MKKADSNFLPVVQRELREGARRPFNYWLRVGGALAGVWLLYALSKQDQGSGMAMAGLHLFTRLHQMMLLLICLIVPAMSADCISSEKREGTLGLLFLTPLTARGIVVGKSLVQALRAFTLWVAVLPVLIIPCLSGGVTTIDICTALNMEFCVTVLCLAAGILASALAKTRTVVFMLAAGFAVVFICLFGGGLALGFVWQHEGFGTPVVLGGLPNSGLSLMAGQSGGRLTSSGSMVFWLQNTSILGALPLGRTTVVVGGPRVPGASFSGRAGGGSGGIVYYPTPASSLSGWSGYFTSAKDRHTWISLLLEGLLTVPLVLYVVLLIAARSIMESWQDRGPSARRESWIKTFSTPLAQRKFKQRMRLTLAWNPIAWLQLYSWKARTSKWLLCLLIVLLECAGTSGSPAQIREAQSTIMLVLAGVFSFFAVNAFFTEKKNGALELLLVTPISPDKIIFGRVWGLWLQFLPAGLTLLLVWMAAAHLAPAPFPANPANDGMLWRFLTSPVSWGTGFDYSTWWQPQERALNYLEAPAFAIFVAVIGFLTLPVFATYFAMRVKNLFVAAALTWLALLLCPFFSFTALGALAFLSSVHLTPADFYVVVFLTTLGFTLLACFLLRHSLSRRIYSF